MAGVIARRNGPKNGKQVKSGHNEAITTKIGSGNAQSERVGGGRYGKR